MGFEGPGKGLVPPSGLFLPGQGPLESSSGKGITAKGQGLHEIGSAPAATVGSLLPEAPCRSKALSGFCKGPDGSGDFAVEADKAKAPFLHVVAGGLATPTERLSLGKKLLPAGLSGDAGPEEGLVGKTQGLLAVPAPQGQVIEPAFPLQKSPFQSVPGPHRLEALSFQSLPIGKAALVVSRLRGRQGRKAGAELLPLAQVVPAALAAPCLGLKVLL